MNSNDLCKAISALKRRPPKISIPVQSTLIIGPQDWPTPFFDDACDDRPVLMPPADVIPRCRIWGRLNAGDAEGMPDFSEHLLLIRDWMNSLGEAQRIAGELMGVSSDCLKASDPLSCWLIYLHESGGSEVKMWELDTDCKADWSQVQWHRDDSNLSNRVWPPKDSFSLAALGRSRISDAVAESIRVAVELAGRLKPMRMEQLAAGIPRPSQKSKIPKSTKSPSLIVGISLRDVASLLTDGDPEAIRDTKRRWHNSRDPKLPTSLGKCAADNRSGLYAPSAILKFVKNVEGLTFPEISKIKQQLRARSRPVRDV